MLHWVFAAACLVGLLQGLSMADARIQEPVNRWLSRLPGVVWALGDQAAEAGRVAVQLARDHQLTDHSLLMYLAAGALLVWLMTRA